jgi:hypothetical protein
LGHAVTAAAKVGTGLAFGEKPKDVLKSTAVNYAVNVASGTIANKIGEWCLEGLDPVIHKLVHAVSGGLMEASRAALLGANREEILEAMGGGAIGAFVAETVAEEKGISDLEKGDLHRGNFGQESATLSQLSSLTGQLAAELSGLDASAALRAGENAVENNCLPFLAVLASGGGGAAAGGVAATGTAATVGSTLAYYGSALLAGLGLSYLADKLSENAMDAAPEGSEWVDEGVQTEDGKATILSTPGSTLLPDLEGYTPAQFDRRYGDEGFQAYHGPDVSVLTKDIAKPVEPYEVGGYTDLAKRSRGDGMEIHHAPQTHPALQVIDGYIRANAPSIALPRDEHKDIPNLKGEFTGTARDLLAKDVRNLRDYTQASNTQIQKLINKTKDMFPNSFEKGQK